MSRPPVIIFSCLQFHEPHQHRSALCAGRGVSRDDCRVGHAGDDAALDHPSHRRLGVIANAASAGEHAKAVAARQLPGVRAWSQAMEMAGHFRKNLLGQQPQTPQNAKTPGLVVGSFFKRRDLTGAYLSPRSRRWFSDFSSPMSISTLCRCTNNSRCSSRIARYSA